MEESGSVIKIIAGIGATLLIVTFGFFVVNYAINKGHNLTNVVSNKLDGVLESEYTQYDGREINGFTVSNLIASTRAGSDNIYISVKTTLATTPVFYVCDVDNNRLTDAAHSALVKASKAKTDNNYINPSQIFIGTVVRTANKAIVGLEFVQQ